VVGGAIAVALAAGCQTGGGGESGGGGERSRPPRADRVLRLEGLDPAPDARATIDPPPPSAELIRLAPAPERIVSACRRLQAEVSFAVLCPTLLPRPLLGWPGRPPPVLGVDRIGPLLDIGYGAPWEGSGVEPHLWRNRPCCFLHFVVGARERRGQYPADWSPAGAQRRILGGIDGQLLLAGGKRFRDVYFGNHVRFFFRRRDVDYVATLHTFGNRATTALLGLLLAHLRPVEELEPIPRGHIGQTLRTGRAGAQGVALGAGAVWTANDGDVLHGLNAPAGRFVRPALVRMDPDSGRVGARIDVGSHPRDVTVAGGVVWVTAARNNDGIIVRVDPRTDRVKRIVRAGTWPQQLIADSKQLWVVNSAPFRRGTLVQIDLATGRVQGEPIPLGPAPSGITLGAGSVWVADALAGTLSRIDAASGRLRARIAVGRDPYGVAFGAGSVWVTNTGAGTVSRVDPATDEVVATVRVGRNPYGIAYDGLVWVANLADGTLTRIDPATNRPAGPPIYVGGEPLAVGAAEGAVCVTSNSEGAVTCLKSDPVDRRD
jgi:YVTN family beta-propeller protein